MSSDKPCASRDVGAISIVLCLSALLYLFFHYAERKANNSTAKQIICNAYDYFENESKKRKGSALPKLGKKTSEATGYCKRTVEQIIAEKRKLEGADLVFQSKKATGDYTMMR